MWEEKSSSCLCQTQSDLKPINEINGHFSHYLQISLTKSLTQRFQSFVKNKKTFLTCFPPPKTPNPKTLNKTSPRKKNPNNQNPNKPQNNQQINDKIKPHSKCHNKLEAQRSKRYYTFCPPLVLDVQLQTPTSLIWLSNQPQGNWW